MQKIPVKNIIDQLDSYYARENFKNAKELINFWSQSAIKFEDWGAQLTLENELIGLVRRTGEEMEGLAAIDRALLLINRDRISDEVAIATTRLNCATTYECFGYFDQALPMYRMAKEAYERLLDPMDHRMGGLLNNMAYAYRRTGDIAEAEKFTQRAIEIMKSNGQLHDAAVSYVNLAEIYEDMLTEASGDIEACKVEADYGNGKACGTEPGPKNAKAFRTYPNLENGETYDAESTSEKVEIYEDELLAKIDSCLMEAYDLLNDPRNIRDGNYAYSLKKCVSGYEHFGYETISRELSVRADRIYAGN